MGFKLKSKIHKYDHFTVILYNYYYICILIYSHREGSPAKHCIQVSFQLLVAIAFISSHEL